MSLRISMPVAALLIFAGASSNSFGQFGKPSQGDQVKLGKKAAQEIRAKEQILPGTDPRVQLVRRVASKLLSTIDDGKAPWEYSFDVIDKKDINAFSLPGGPTFVYTGLLEKIHSEDELAAVMGHELTHVRKEHWAYQYRDEQSRNLGLSLLMIFGHVNQTLGNIMSIGTDVLVNMPYSRGHESEADDGGFDMMAKAGYNPQGMVDLFTTLKNSGGSKNPEWLSDHPADAKRIEHVQNRIKAANRTWPPLTPLNLKYYDSWNSTKSKDQDKSGGGL